MTKFMWQNFERLVQDENASIAVTSLVAAASEAQQLHAFRMMCNMTTENLIFLCERSFCAVLTLVRTAIECEIQFEMFEAQMLSSALSC